MKIFNSRRESHGVCLISIARLSTMASLYDYVNCVWDGEHGARMNFIKGPELEEQGRDIS